MLVIGAAIGVEFSYFFNAIGTEVHIVEMADQLLPVEDADSAKVWKLNSKSKVSCYTKTKTKSVDVIKKGKIKAVLEDAKGKETEIEVDRVLVAVGMVANTKELTKALVSLTNAAIS